MEHVKKMLLVEPSLIDKISQKNVGDGMNNPKSRLDVEMQNILKSNDDDRKNAFCTYKFYKDINTLLEKIVNLTNLQ